jgi:hypothetical protein
MANPLSQEIRHNAGSNCGATVSTLRDLIKDPIRDILRAATTEEKAAKAANTTPGGFDNDNSVFEQIAVETEAAIDNVFGNPLSEIPLAVQDLLGSATGDLTTLLTGTLSGLITPGNTEDDCGSKLGSSTITAAFNGLSSQLSGEIDRANILTSQVSSVFSALRSSDKGGPGSFGLGLMHSAMNALKSSLTNELFILGQLTSLITSINKNVNKIKDSDYSTDHLLLVTICQALLLDADRNLGSVLLGMSEGGRLNRDMFNVANADVKLARDLLAGTELSDIFGKLTSPLTLLIAAQITLLIAYTQALEQLAKINKGKVDRIGNFLIQYKLYQPNVDFLYAPTIELMRCRLAKIILDMGATAKLNQVFAFMIREKKWWVQLSIILALFDGCKLLDTANENLDKIKVDWQVRVGRVADSYPTNLSVDMVVAELRAYIALVKQKLSFNIPASVVTARGDYAINLINSYLTDATAMAGRRLAQDVFGGILPDGIVNNIALTEIANPLIDVMDALETVAGPGIALAQTYLSYLDKNDMSGFSNALRDGDVAKMFSLDGLTSTLFAQAGEYVNAAFFCYSNQDDPMAMQVLRRNGAMFQDQQRADALYQLTTVGYMKQHTDVVFQTEMPELNRNQADLKTLQ